MRCIATGENFLGSEEFATEKGNVLYIDQEMPASELQKRCRQLGLSERDQKIWFFTNESEEPLNLSKEAKVNWLLEFIEKEKIKVVFIDTLRAVAGGLKEEKAEEVRAFFNLFRQVKNRGVTIVFLDHCRKPNHFEGKIPKKEQLFASQDKAASVEIEIR